MNSVSETATGKAPSAGKPAERSMLVDVPRLVTAYYTKVPAPSVPEHGIVPALLSAEITAQMGRDPGEIYHALERELGAPLYDRVEAKATPAQKAMLERLSPQQVRSANLGGETIQTILTHAPGNGAPIGGLKVIAESGWFAARPSGTEDIYKVYAESFRSAEHLRRILDEAQTIVSEALAEPHRTGSTATAGL